MKQVLGISAAVIAGVVLMASAPLAMAHDRVNWSLNIGVPYAAPVYSPPPVVYVQPQPVYVEPAPVYVQPAPVVQYRSYYYPQPYVVEQVRIRPYRHWHHR